MNTESVFACSWKLFNGDGQTDKAGDRHVFQFPEATAFDRSRENSGHTFWREGERQGMDEPAVW